MPTDLGNRLLTRAALRLIYPVSLHFHHFRCPAGPFRLAYARGDTTLGLVCIFIGFDVLGSDRERFGCSDVIQRRTNEYFA
jgi:hypothetical protein